MKFLILNGPNINLARWSEPGVPGEVDYTGLMDYVQAGCDQLGIETDICQSNHEGDLIDEIQSAPGRVDGIVLNPGGYAHYSVAILDGGVVVEQGSVQEIFANPKTAAAKRLVAPNGGSAARDLSCFAPDDHVVRVTFNGASTAKPLVASLAAEKGILVSVLSADTRDLSGQCYGSMLLKLPAELAVAQQAVEYMRSQSGVTVEEVTGI